MALFCLFKASYDVVILKEHIKNQCFVKNFNYNVVEMIDNTREFFGDTPHDSPNQSTHPGESRQNCVKIMRGSGIDGISQIALDEYNLNLKGQSFCKSDFDMDRIKPPTVRKQEEDKNKGETERELYILNRMKEDHDRRLEENDWDQDDPTSWWHQQFIGKDGMGSILIPNEEEEEEPIILTPQEKVFNFDFIRLIGFTSSISSLRLFSMMTWMTVKKFLTL